jgi:hypothetical protein
MNCFYHAEAPNVAFCIHCGRALCNECIRNVKGERLLRTMSRRVCRRQGVCVVLFWVIYSKWG